MLDHPEFTSIAWKDLNEKSDPIPWPGIAYFYAFFDINNDGKRDHVVRESASLGGTPSDNLYVFKSEVRDGQKVQSVKNNDAFLIMKFDRTGQFYELAHVKPQVFSAGQFKGKSIPVMMRVSEILCKRVFG